MSFNISAPEWVAELGLVSLVGFPPYIPVPNVNSGGGTIAVSGGSPPEILAQLVSSTVPVSPGSVLVKIANGVPGATATVSIASNLRAATTVTLDESGTANGVAVPLSVAAPGTFAVTVSDGATAATTSVAVSSVAVPRTFATATVTPPTAVQNTTGVVKWTFQDPATGEVYHFPYNPSQMTSPFGPKNITYAPTTAIDGNKLSFEGQQAPVQWQFQGFIRSQAEHDAFIHWVGKRNRVWITDHFGRAWLAYLTQFEAIPHPANDIPWAQDYTMHALIFDGPVTPGT